MTRAEIKKLKELMTDHNQDCIYCKHFLKDCKESDYGKAQDCERYEKIGKQ